jgi:transposase-like protein
VITVAVRWYLRYGLSYRDVEELLAERGVEVDHVTVYRWVQRLTPLFADAARPLRHATGDRWFVDETYVKVAGQWRYLYRALDQYGQVIDVLLSEHRDTAAARRFLTRALHHGPAPAEVTTDKAGPYLRVLDELIPTAAHVTEQFANNRAEADHARLKAAAAHARTETVPFGRANRRRPCDGPEPPARPLRTRHRRPTAAPPGHRIHRARPGHVTSASSKPDACQLSLNATDPDGLVPGHHLDRYRPLVRVHPDHDSVGVLTSQCLAHPSSVARSARDIERGGHRCFELGKPLSSLSRSSSDARPAQAKREPHDQRGQPM